MFVFFFFLLQYVQQLGREMFRGLRRFLSVQDVGQIGDSLRGKLCRTIRQNDATSGIAICRAPSPSTKEGRRCRWYGQSLKNNKTRKRHHKKKHNYTGSPCLVCTKCNVTLVEADTCPLQQRLGIKIGVWHRIHGCRRWLPSPTSPLFAVW